MPALTEPCNIFCWSATVSLGLGKLDNSPPSSLGKVWRCKVNLKALFLEVVRIRSFAKVLLG